MRRWPFLILLLAAACARPVPAPAPATAAGPRTITLVTTTDIHGRLESLPWISGYVQNLRAARRAEGGDVLLVDAGDMWQGTLESNLGEGAASVRAYNALGYHAVTIGNHEFDFGPVGPRTVPRDASDNPTGNIEARARQARFPFLAANLLTREGGPWTPPNVRPSVMVTVAGVRVGLVGVTTTATPSATDPRNLVRLTVAPLRDIVVREATRLRSEGAAVVVLLAHAGGRCEAFGDPDDVSSCREQGEIFRLARALPAGLVDAIAAGHAHDGIAHRVSGIAIVEPFNVGRAFGRVDLVVDPAAGRVTSSRIHPPQYVCDGRTPREIDTWAADACQPPAYEGRPVRRDAALIAVLRDDIERARRRREQPLGVTAAQAYPHSTRDESPASNLVVDLLRAAHPEADVAIYNATGTRTSLPAGPITYGKLYALLPFDSVVATATLPVATVSEAILRGVTRGPIPIVSGIEVTITCDGTTPRVAVSRNGQVLPADAPLKVVTSEFLSSGGGGYFPDMAERFTLQLDTPMRESIVSVIGSQARGIVAGTVGHHDPDRKRVRVPGNTYPVRCQ
ncbi:multifunctional 2',3'-cyclic-nucleotide 2'-phosphodiesterase/5'-nucleotidase/3'-nucleotidase [Luteitalea sp. TBR-22]|uniref:bifunctional metallophosphatase/5'-nucleotidase n=1 Tax=Luteitalea sp. TBR-22 TaxID=2802971 RepID=UPI001EF751D7|nr:bifunctional UDP-sugar hydrolase/5'-nucleotidase [Luteitalea sp. TBR-22]BCS31935.2 multifunctional 2',3'-cyclic-nucleotide 2'-phosphodiesterase/5'-nucleotidase/3'-nucleotidase [Luteitalea sp. TBR-22]